MNTQRLTLITAVVVALAIIAVIVFSRLQGPTTATPSSISSGELVYKGQPTLGDETAPVRLAVFEDFKCPFCRQFEETIMPQLEREYIDTGQAQLTFINFHFIGPDSETAAIAGECAFEQSPEAFWEYKAVIYRAQESESQTWATPARLEELAQDVGDLDAVALRECVDEGRYAEAAESDNAMARAVGVSATPTLLVNGEPVPSALNYEAIKAAIDDALGE